MVVGRECFVAQIDRVDHHIQNDSRWVVLLPFMDPVVCDEIVEPILKGRVRGVNERVAEQLTDLVSGPTINTDMY